MSVNELYLVFVEKLKNIYDEREAANIADWVFESTAGLNRMKRLMSKHDELEVNVSEVLQRQLSELLTHKPVQYVLGEVFFYKLKLKVNEHVLIPRPETEELVEWVSEFLKESKTSDFSVIDIGTGSGCIPISLKKNFSSINITAIDVSEDALSLAKENAMIHNTIVSFQQIDFLDRKQWERLNNYDIIISNPPYIPQHEKASLDRNVTDFEPHIALFVPDNNPLLFYRKIISFAKDHLKSGGHVVLEIHENYSKEIEKLFSENDWNITIKKDIYGRERMAKANKI